MLLAETFMGDVARDPKFPEIKKGNSTSFEEILDHLGFSPTVNYRDSNQTVQDAKYSISHQLNTTPTNRHYKVDVQNRRKLKQAFMLSADHDWFEKSVHPVFWYGWTRPIEANELPFLLWNACKKYSGGQANHFETSAVGYLKDLLPSQPRLNLAHDFGFEIQGRITYAVRGDAWANERRRAHTTVKQYYSNSGQFGKSEGKPKNAIPIRPAAFDHASLDVVLGPDQVDKDIIGEVIVDRFVVKSVVLNYNDIMVSNITKTSAQEKMKEIYEEIESSGTIAGLPVKTIGRKKPLEFGYFF